MTLDPVGILGRGANVKFFNLHKRDNLKISAPTVSICKSSVCGACAWQGRAIVAAIGTGGLQAETFTQEDIDAVFDDEGGGYIPPSGGDETFTQEDIDAIFADDTVDYEGFTDDDIAEIFAA